MPTNLTSTNALKALIGKLIMPYWYLVSTIYKRMDSEVKIHTKIIYDHHQSILPKGRSFTANSGTKAVVLLEGGLPPQVRNPGCSFTRDG